MLNTQLCSSITNSLDSDLSKTVTLIFLFLHKCICEKRKNVLQEFANKNICIYFRINAFEVMKIRAGLQPIKEKL